jgi:hypothetical protein
LSSLQARLLLTKEVAALRRGRGKGVVKVLGIVVETEEVVPDVGKAIMKGYLMERMCGDIHHLM